MRTIAVYSDYKSPYAYLAKDLVYALARDCAVKIDWLPYTLDIPSALVKDKVTPADWAMAALASAYWVQFATSGDPNGGSRPKWSPHDPAVDKVTDFADHGLTEGPDPLKPRLDLWQRYWEEKK